MKCTIFYSWQSDLPNGTNRTFIEEALQAAASELRSDDTIDVEPIVDRDTAGLPGSPDIGHAIFEKITKADIFVCDVSMVHPEEVERRSPNPNVLVEVGYALGKLGHERIITIINTAFGGPELLPFDLKQKRALTYSLQKGEVKATSKKELSAKLTSALRAILSTLKTRPPAAPEKTAVELALEAITSSRADQMKRVREYMQAVGSEISKLEPRSRSGDQEELLLAAIAASSSIVREFGQVAEAVASMNAIEAGRVLVKGFEYVMACYQPSASVTRYYESDFDLAKFLGHELFVTLVAHVLRNERPALLAELLQQQIYRTAHPGSQAGTVEWIELSTSVLLLDQRSQRKGRISVHADLLKERHTDGALAEDVPWDEFLDADLVLFIASPTIFGNTPGWRPWSYIYLREATRTLLEAKSRNGAKYLALILGEESTAAVRSRVLERLQFLVELLSSARVPFASRMLDFNPASIAEF